MVKKALFHISTEKKKLIVSEFIKKIAKHGNPEWIYLLRGRVLPDYDVREFGISRQIIIKTLSKSFGVLSSEVLSEFNKIGAFFQPPSSSKCKKSSKYNYNAPDFDEIENHFNKVFGMLKNGEMLMIDTAPSYGDSEEKIGRYLCIRPSTVPSLIF